jgi:dephospho-CoA kinase
VKVIGLTGGIASGKSTIARRFAEHGAVVVDADILARQAVEVGSPTLARIVDTFGSQVVASDGSLDRSALARIVFSDSAARNTLNSIVHPEVRRRGAEAIEQAYAKNPNVIVVYDIPLLAEGRTRDEFDLVIVATATHSVRRAHRDARPFQN